MTGESQQAPLAEPDPSVLTTEQMLLSVENLQELTKAHREGATSSLRWQIDSIRRELVIREAHRLELKADSKETLATATIAAEKAVQAALAAAEKASEKQTIASQLATTKSEEVSKEAFKQQGETFTLAISGLTVGLTDVKQLLTEMRSERKGSNDSRVALFAFAGFLAALVVVGGFLVAAWPR